MDLLAPTLFVGAEVYFPLLLTIREHIQFIEYFEKISFVSINAIQKPMNIANNRISD